MWKPSQLVGGYISEPSLKLSEKAPDKKMASAIKEVCIRLSILFSAFTLSKLDVCSRSPLFNLISFDTKRGIQKLSTHEKNSSLLLVREMSMLWCLIFASLMTFLALLILSIDLLKTKISDAESLRTRHDSNNLICEVSNFKFDMAHRIDG